MQIHNIVRKTKNKKSVQVGRGGTRGKTSGRGTKGQKARAGRKLRPEMRDIIKKIPKLRGRGVNSFKSFTTKAKAINLSEIEKAFSNGDVISPRSLVEKKVITLESGKHSKVKILSGGDLTKKFVFENCSVSAKAIEKIVAAGGEIKKA